MMAPFLKLPIRHRSRPEDLPGVVGPARLDRRTKNLTKRLRMGEIAIIDHADLDRLGAEALLRQQVAAVVNVAPSITGRYPNLGPAAAGGGRGAAGGRRRARTCSPRSARAAVVRLQGDTLYAGDEVVAKGRMQTAEYGGRGDDRRQGRHRGPAPGLRDQHAGVHEGRGRAADRRHRRPRATDQDRRAARAGGGARQPVPRGPRGPAALHPRVQARHGGRGRRGRRAAGGRLPARHDRRRHGLGHRRGAALRGGAGGARLPRRRPGPRPGAGRAPRAAARWPAPPAAPARTWPC